MIKRWLTLVLLISLCSLAWAEELNTIKLSPPQLDSGKSLMQALSERKSDRSFASRPIPMEILSNLLWAACGINRPDSGKRTAPSALDQQEIDVYVATAQGLFRYQPQGHTLVQILNQDIRALTGKQGYAAEAPVNLIYVADFSGIGLKMILSKEEKQFYAAADTGFISQNVYLYCASAGLATVVRGWINKESLAKVMQLKPSQQIMLAQSVGYPK